MSSWERSACYPRSTFYPLSDGKSIFYRRITMSNFRSWSTCQSRSQAPLSHCTLRTVTNRAEGTFVLLRYALGGDRPSQTTHHTLSSIRITDLSENANDARLVFQGWLRSNWRPRFKASQLSYTGNISVQCEAIVKVHGVFPSSRGYTASSRRFQFH